MSRLLRTNLIAVLLMSLALLAGACGGDEDSAADSFEASSAGEDSGDFALGAAAEVEEVDADGGGDASSPLPPAGDPGPAVPAGGERIIKEGTVTVRVEAGQFDAAFSQIVSRTQSLGGYVSGSSTSMDPDGLVTGQVTVRVPVEVFEDLLTAVGDAGEVTDREVTSQDVSEEFTDLQARRRNLQAQEAFYLGLLEQAQTINDAIAVRQELEGIQEQIERITGRLNLLENRSSLSTLTVRLNEIGAEGVGPDESPGQIAAAFDEAGDVLLSAVAFLIIAGAGLLPFAVAGGIVLLVLLAVRRGRRGAAQERPSVAAESVAGEAAAGERDDDRESTSV